VPRVSPVQTALRNWSIKARLEGSTLVAQHEHYTTRIEVLPPESRVSERGSIRAVLRTTTEMPRPIAELYKDPESTVAMNSFAALSAVSWDRGRPYIGSRLTLYETEDAWATLHTNSGTTVISIWNLRWDQVDFAQAVPHVRNYK
jgi:hypothetical protein